MNSLIRHDHYLPGSPVYTTTNLLSSQVSATQRLWHGPAGTQLNHLLDVVDPACLGVKLSPYTARLYAACTAAQLCQVSAQ